MGVAIRSARAADAEDVVALWRTAADVLPSTTDDESAVAALLARDPEALLVVEQNGRIVATVIVGWDGWRGNLYRLAVAPDARRTGLASRLVREAERRLTAQGCRRVAAAVELAEQHAVEFWTAVGYGASGTNGRFVKNIA